MCCFLRRGKTKWRQKGWNGIKLKDLMKWNSFAAEGPPAHNPLQFISLATQERKQEKQTNHQLIAGFPRPAAINGCWVVCSLTALRLGRRFIHSTKGRQRKKFISINSLLLLISFLSFLSFGFIHFTFFVCLQLHWLNWLIWFACFLFCGALWRCCAHNPPQNEKQINQPNNK